jgi:hypothetical protein
VSDPEARREPSRDPKAPAQLIPISKPLVAQSQLETAILIWFHYGDPVSIQALAYSANDCYHAIGKMEGTPTLIQAWLKSLSRTNYDQVQESINFAKHGWKKLKGISHIVTEYAELLMLDSIGCHEKLFHEKTPLMSCFFARFAAEHPRILDHILKPEARPYFKERVEVDKLAEFGRVDYLNQVLPVITAAGGGTFL